MNAHHWRLPLAACFLLFAADFSIFFLNPTKLLFTPGGGINFELLMYFPLVVVIGACASLFTGLICFRNLFLFSPPIARALWGVAGCAGLMPVVYMFWVFAVI